MSCLVAEQLGFPASVGVAGGLKLNARSLGKRYGEVWAVSDVSIGLERGQAVGLLGPNGAGKSTTMLMLAGVVRPDRGSISVSGEADPCRASVRRHIGFAPQALALYPELTAAENLTLLGRLYKLPRHSLRKRVIEALELAQLTERAHHRVRTFSGGMQRRLNLAAATVHDPSVLLLDEPTVGVDPQSRAHIYCCIEQLKQRGMSIVYSTHHLEEAERLCDRVTIMDRGCVLVTGSVDELLRRLGSGARVQARMPRRPACDDLAKHWKEGVFCCTSQQPQELLQALLRIGAEFSELSVRDLGLEGVFMSLTGRSMRDS